MNPGYAILTASALLLAACAGVTGGWSGPKPRSGGSAGQMGPGYCHTLPADLSARNQWNDLCFPND